MALFDKPLTPSVTFTPDSAIYAANDSIGGALSFDVSGSASGVGILNKVLVVDNEGIGAAGDLWLFKQDLASPIADNSPFLVAFADYANFLTVVTLAAFTSNNSMKKSFTTDINDMINWSKSSIIGYYVPSGTPDWGSTKSIYIQLGILTQ